MIIHVYNLEDTTTNGYMFFLYYINVIQNDRGQGFVATSV